jgi:DNA-binding response OmpR family regulator
MEEIKILLVEDDENLGLLLQESFMMKGLEVTLCREGESAIKCFNSSHFDLCILDIMMPKKDGFSVAQEIRILNPTIPFIFLTARSLDEDKHRAFHLGCDDYVTKPFSAQELFLRIKAILNRYRSKNESSDSTDGVIQIGKFTFDYKKRTIRIGKDVRKLSAKEAELLFLFSTNKNQILRRKTILIKIWNNDDFFASKSMDVYLTKIRKFLKPDPEVEVQNIHGIGYKLVVE